MVKTEDLKRITLLKDVPQHLLDILAQEAQLSIFGAQTELVTLNEPVTTFFMLLMGQVAVKRELNEDIDVILDYIQSGSTFGSSAFIPESTAKYTATCQEPCEVITLSGSRMLELFTQNDELAYYVMSGIAGQYKQNMDLRAEMIMKTLDENPSVKKDIKDIENLTLSL